MSNLILIKFSVLDLDVGVSYVYAEFDHFDPFLLPKEDI